MVGDVRMVNSDQTKVDEEKKDEPRIEKREKYEVYNQEQVAFLLL